MKRTLNTTINRSKSEKNDEHYTQLSDIEVEVRGIITNIVEYVWGKDLSGTFQGAGGVGGLLYEKRNGAIYIPYQDAFGNIMGYWDTNGVIVAEYTYDAFGKMIAQSGSMADVFRHRFSTKCYDEETGFYYYGYRYYFPELRRWLSRDPLEEEGGNNLYAMLGNNSISDFDSTGEIGNKNKDKAWNFVARWHESHSWNCSEWKHLRGKHMSGTKDKYIEHFEKYTFVGNKKVSESAKAGFSYSIPNALRMDQNPSYCWCAELDFVLEINARGQYRLKMHVQTLDVHPTCCEKPENHVSGLEGRNFTLGPY